MSISSLIRSSFVGFQQGAELISFFMESLGRSFMISLLVITSNYAFVVRISSSSKITRLNKYFSMFFTPNYFKRNA